MKELTFEEKLDVALEQMINKPAFGLDKNTLKIFDLNRVNEKGGVYEVGSFLKEGDIDEMWITYCNEREIKRILSQELCKIIISVWFD